MCHLLESDGSILTLPKGLLMLSPCHFQNAIRGIKFLFLITRNPTAISASDIVTLNNNMSVNTVIIDFMCHFQNLKSSDSASDIVTQIAIKYFQIFSDFLFYTLVFSLHLLFS